MNKTIFTIALLSVITLFAFMPVPSSKKSVAKLSSQTPCAVGYHRVDNAPVSDCEAYLSNNSQY